uniref:Uncharacterized protein n=1 Tax=Palpitomonas bilix TaxID=652834 RepID=A0A7S3D517_9EUKA
MEKARKWLKEHYREVAPGRKKSDFDKQYRMYEMLIVDDPIFKTDGEGKYFVLLSDYVRYQLSIQRHGEKKRVIGLHDVSSEWREVDLHDIYYDSPLRTSMAKLREKKDVNDMPFTAYGFRYLPIYPSPDGVGISMTDRAKQIQPLSKLTAKNDAGYCSARLTHCVEEGTYVFEAMMDGEG